LRAEFQEFELKGCLVRMLEQIEGVEDIEAPAVEVQVSEATSQRRTDFMGMSMEALVMGMLMECVMITDGKNPTNTE
jgi:hypothetical protein